MWIEKGCDPHWADKASSLVKKYDTIYIEQEKMARLVSEVKRFTSAEAAKLAEERGVAHKLSILFEGPPGSGKTSIAKAIATETHSDMFIINVVGIKRLEDMVFQMSTEAKDKCCVVLIEDIHAVPAELYGQIYNLLQGGYDLNNVIFILTSNVPHEELDPIMFRPGRVDLIYRFGYMSAEAKAAHGRQTPSRACRDRVSQPNSPDQDHAGSAGGLLEPDPRHELLYGCNTYACKPIRIGRYDW
ncbi:MAG: ATP-binding protein [Desulfosporosinus sp.]|nr:ATP-binding protein [Desulfosporosinus sp.]